MTRSGNFKEGLNKTNTINKIGHALHARDDVYRRFSLENPRLKTLARDLGVHRDPRVLQSMLIFKQPKIGGKGEFQYDHHWAVATWAPFETALRVC